MIEYLAHLDPGKPPKDLMLARADIPDGVSQLRIAIGDLPTAWRSYPASDELQALGDRFTQDLQACVLVVPSVLAVTDHNWVLNPAHADFRKIILHPAEPFNYDPRLLERRGKRSLNQRLRSASLEGTPRLQPLGYEVEE